MNPFEYKRAGSVAEAIRDNAGRQNAKFLAGGTNLIDLMKYDIERHDNLIDVSRLPLAKIEDHEGGLRIGTMVRNADLAQDPRVVQRYAALSSALLQGASPQLRNLASTGGNLLQRTRCYYFYDTALPCNKREPGSGCPAVEGYNRIHAILGTSDQCIATHPSDMAVAMRLLDAVVQVQSPRGNRSIPIAEFHRLPGDTPQIDTNLAKDELITHVDLPALAAGTKSTYVKVRDRQSYAFALVSVAALMGPNGDVRIALGGAEGLRVHRLPLEVRLGLLRAPRLVSHAAEAELADAKGYEHNAFKIELAKRTIVRALTELA
jgi:xanthine dehydrogenase YagS FAD-binding subunit